MTQKNVTLEIHERVAILTLNRPDVLNSLNETLARDAREALAQVRENSFLRALIVTGAGRAFCAGAELNDELADSDEHQSAGQRLNATMLDYFNPWIIDLDSLQIPVIAAINGVAAGAGVGLALAADITLAARSASFILSFAPKLGLVPDLGTTWRLPKRIGQARAMALSLLGNKLDAQTAADWGMIWQCVEDDELLNVAMKTAQALARSPAHAILEVRRALRLAETNNLKQQLDYERERQCQLVEKPTFKEGVNAFKEKRLPVFDRV
ncbi:enoyl-CoA hydratase-related protein [Pseudomonas sp. QLc11A]|uniref:Enoyl-CoA hydratase-related protein n=1 Tax=Pseudomonas azerbaijanorientalis TaxID=2842350 RepID=A0ABW8W2R9_9PSED